MGRKNDQWRELNANGKVEVTVDEFREYINLLHGRDKQLEAIRTQARIQNAESLNMAREFVKAIDSLLAIQGLELIAGKEMKTAYEHANDLLATE